MTWVNKPGTDNQSASHDRSPPHQNQALNKPSGSVLFNPRRELHKPPLSAPTKCAHVQTTTSQKQFSITPHPIHIASMTSSRNSFQTASLKSIRHLAELKEATLSTKLLPTPWVSPKPKHEPAADKTKLHGVRCTLLARYKELMRTPPSSSGSVPRPILLPRANQPPTEHGA